MRNSIIFVFLFVIAIVFAQDKPTNYFAASSSARGQQQQISSFAVWNLTSNSWINVIPPNVGLGSVNGIVAVGTGLLAYGSFQNVAGRDASGLAYYDGKVWCAPEGVGLFLYTPDVTTTQYNITTAKSSAIAAVVVGNDVYLYGTFNQVGLLRDSVAGFAKLTWSAGGIFSVSKIGTQGYNQIQNNLPCTFCQRDTQPSGSKNKLLTHVVNGNTYFVFQDNSPGDIWQWQVDSPRWVKITNENTARNITGVVRDFDLNSGNIYVVGNINNLNDPVANNQYLHIACSTNLGNTWTAVAATNPLPLANFGDLGPLPNNISGINLPTLTGTGLFSIAVENTNSIYVAGGWRITERNLTLDNLAGQLQTRVIRITGTSYTLVSERFAGAFFGGYPDFVGPTIYRLVFSNNVLYAFGDFTSYRQVIPLQGSRFGNRFTDVYKGAAQLSNGVWTPAFGGFLTTSYNLDASPATVFTAFSGSNVFFYGGIQSSYNILSGGIFAYGGDKNANKNNRWNAVLSNQRIVSSATYQSGISNEGTINALHITKKNDALIIGGQFDWIGSQRIGGIAAYNPVSDTVQQIGGGIYQTNNNPSYFADNFYNNRVGGVVYDIEEWNDRLIIGGVFQRNNSGNCVSNIAWNKFRISGAGWEAIDGGCDSNVLDILVVGSTLYITGDFLFCGLNPAGYNGGLYRGSIPTNRIARIDLSDNNASWRNLGVGITSTGRALAWRNGDLFVGGSFSLAGGRIATSGIARWRGDHWEDVVAKCRGYCDRAVNVLPYITTAQVPSAANRKPTSCVNLRNINGRIYCIDTGLGGRLAYFDSNTWYQAGDFTVSVSGIQNSVIVRNSTNDQFILVPSTSSTGANGANYVAYDANNIQFAPSHGGFSSAPLAFAEGSSLIIPKFIIAIIVLIFSFLF